MYKRDRWIKAGGGSSVILLLLRVWEGGRGGGGEEGRRGEIIKAQGRKKSRFLSFVVQIIGKPRAYTFRARNKSRRHSQEAKQRARATAQRLSPKGSFLSSGFWGARWGRVFFLRVHVFDLDFRFSLSTTRGAPCAASSCGAWGQPRRPSPLQSPRRSRRPRSPGRQRRRRDPREGAQLRRRRRRRRRRHRRSRRIPSAAFPGTTFLFRCRRCCHWQQQ